jgi:hypothetical protein
MPFILTTFKPDGTHSRIAIIAAADVADYFDTHGRYWTRRHIEPIALPNGSTVHVQRVSWGKLAELTP